MKATKRGLQRLTENIKNETDAVAIEVQKRTLGYILAGLGVVCGMAWNEAIKAAINFLFPLDSGNSILAQFAYAGILTILIVVASIYLSRLFKVDED